MADVGLTKQDGKRIPSLDGLRGLSIGAVLFAHTSSHFTHSFLHQRLLRMVSAGLGYFGVTTFFVISGFLITKLMLKERERTGGVSLSGFYRRRAVRILPAFLVYTAVIICFGHPTLLQEALALTFSTSFAFDKAYRPLEQLWSLSVEEMFYLAWPLLMAWSLTRARKACWIVMIACPLLRMALKIVGYREYSHLGPAILDSIAAGCLLAYYHEEVRNRVRRLLHSGLLFTCAGLGAVGFALVVYRLDLVLLWGIASSMVAVIIAAAIERKDRVLNAGPLVWTGLLSYSLYLWQQPMLVMDGPLHSPAIRLSLAFLAAWFSYRLVEQPALGLFSRARRASTAMATLPKAVVET